MTEENIQKLEQLHKEQNNDKQEEEKKSDDVQREMLEDMLS